MIKLNTQASGKFTVYTLNEQGQLEVIAEAKNAITWDGLNAVATNTWASLLSTGLLGSGTEPVEQTNNGGTMEVELISDNLLPYGSPSMPSCYTLTEYDDNAGMVYRLGKSFQFTNNTPDPVVITEIGVAMNRPVDETDKTYKLFSRAFATAPFTIKPNLFVFVMYELRLVTGVSTTRQFFQVQTDNPSLTTLSFPLSTQLGVFANPYASLSGNGFVYNNRLSSIGEGFFEPSNSQYYLYTMHTVPSAIDIPTGTLRPNLSGYFDNKREFFENAEFALRPLNACPTISAVPGVIAPVLSSIEGAYKFTNEDNGFYELSSYKRARHIIVVPDSPSIPVPLYGFTISNKSLTRISEVDETGYHIVFPGLSSAWIKPKNYFMKFYMEQSWSYQP